MSSLFLLQCHIGRFLLASRLCVYAKHPLWLQLWEKQCYSEKKMFLGLLLLVLEGRLCLSWPGSSLSVWSGIRAGDCAEQEGGVMAGGEFWMVASSSVFVWRGSSIRGRSFGFRPLFLPVVAPFLTSALNPLLSNPLLLLPETTWLVDARNQFWKKKLIKSGPRQDQDEAINYIICAVIWHIDF